MSGRHIPLALRSQVRQRAAGRCEYCLVHEDHVIAPHEPDHITAEQHRGATSAENLAFACYHCNRLKGTNIASVDPGTGQKAFLYDPRKDTWSQHFKVEGAEIIGLTAVGRATAALLRFNEPDRAELRATLIRAGRYP
jgi:hypothetical protein